MDYKIKREIALRRLIARISPDSNHFMIFYVSRRPADNKDPYFIELTKCVNKLFNWEAAPAFNEVYNAYLKLNETSKINAVYNKTLK